MKWLPAEQPPQDHEDILIWRSWQVTAVVGWYSPDTDQWYVYQVDNFGNPSSIHGCIQVNDVLAWLPIPRQNHREQLGGTNE